MGKSRGGIGATLIANRRGSVAVLFGISITAILAVVGAAIDFARWHSARTVTLLAVDAAVLAGARVLQIEGASPADAIAAAQRYYRRQIANRVGVVDDRVTFDVADGGAAVLARGRAALETALLKLGGIRQLEIAAFSNGDLSEAVLSKGIHARQSIELALILDTSSSMSGQRLDDLKAAAKDLLDIVVWGSNHTGHTARAAIVPYADAVLVPPSVFAGAAKPGPGRVDFLLGIGVSIPWWRAGDCLAERDGPAAFSDAAPTTDDRRFSGVYTWSGRCRPQQAMLPLTSDRALLRTRIDALTPGGGTALHAGIGWAWNALSPHWAGIWPGSSTPDSYQRLSQLGPDGTPILRKIAVIVTDGESTTEYCANGLRATRTGYEHVTADCVAGNGPSAMQVRTLCTNMKGRGIEVYAIGLALAQGGEASGTMRHCASSADHHYRPDNGGQLRQAFRDAALKISSIHLAK